MNERGPQLGSLDSWTDAEEVLDKSDFPWILFGGLYEKASVVSSKLSPENAAMIRQWCDSGHFVEVIKTHLKNVYGIE